jgi:cell division septal protein FtsQ
MKKRKYKHKKARTNPYFRTSAKKKLSRSAIKYSLIIAALLTTVGASTYAPIFRISMVNVTGGSDEFNGKVQQFSEITLRHKRFFILPSNHRLSFNPEAFSALLISEFPLSAASVKVKKSELTIDITEKVSTFYLIKNDVMFALDRTGNILNTVNDLERARIETNYKAGKGAPIIYDNRSSTINASQTVLSHERLEDIVKLFDSIRSRTMLTPKRAVLSDEDGRVDVDTENGVQLYFTLNRLIDLQIDKLESLIDRQLVQIEDLSYIDLRSTNRLFYH